MTERRNEPNARRRRRFRSDRLRSSESIRLPVDYHHRQHRLSGDDGSIDFLAECLGDDGRLRYSRGRFLRHDLPSVRSIDSFLEFSTSVCSSFPRRSVVMVSFYFDKKRAIANGNDRRCFVHPSGNAFSQASSRLERASASCPSVHWPNSS